MAADEKERNALHELKKRMEGEMDNELYEDDHFLIRFLRARDLNVDLAETMLRTHLKWRLKYDVKNIWKYNPPEVLKKYMTTSFLGFSKEGYVVTYVPTGKFDCRGIWDSCTFEDWTKHFVKLFEEDLARLKKQSQKLGRLVDKVIYIHDLRGGTLAKVTDRKVIMSLINMCHLYQDNYPECLKNVFILYAPAYVSIIYSVMKTVLPNQILKKIRIYSDESWRNDLLELVDPEVLPAFLGGKITDPDGNPLCRSFVNFGGQVPEEYYLKKNTFSSLPDVQKIIVPRSGAHKMNLEVKHPESYFEWEFQVKSGDIKFGVIYQDTQANKTEVLPFQRIATEDGTETGVHKCKKAGKYVIVFDNSYSYVRSKEVFCKVHVISPKNDIQVI